jgi:3-oxoadipate enol-lactonase
MMRDVDAQPVAWREAGDRDVVVFLHGLGGSRTAWEPQLEALAGRWRCVAWDLPGYGASPPVDGPLTFSALADAVAALLDALHVARAPLVGLSLGGMVALHTALGHPDRVSGMALLDTSPAFGGDGTDPDEWRAARLAPLEAGRTPADMAIDVLTAVGGPALAGRSLDTAVAAMSRIPADGLRAAIDCLPTHDVRDRLGEIGVPTLVAVGELDEETPPAYSRMLADGIPGASLEIIAGAGHLSNLEQPDAVNRLLSEFLPTTFLSPTTRSRTE